MTSIGRRASDGEQIGVDVADVRSTSAAVAAAAVEIKIVLSFGDVNGGSDGGGDGGSSGDFHRAVNSGFRAVLHRRGGRDKGCGGAGVRRSRGEGGVAACDHRGRIVKRIARRCSSRGEADKIWSADFVVADADAESVRAPAIIRPSGGDNGCGGDVILPDVLPVRGRR